MKTKVIIELRGQKEQINIACEELGEFLLGLEKHRNIKSRIR